jgi:hypothetical protein
VYGRNIFDDDTPTSISYSSNLPGTSPVRFTDPRTTFAYKSEQYGAPRTFGATLNVEF